MNDSGADPHTAGYSEHPAGTTGSSLRPPSTGATLAGSCALPATELLSIEEHRRNNSSSIGSNDSGVHAEAESRDVAAVQGVRDVRPQGTASAGMPAVLSMVDMVTHQNPAYFQEPPAAQHYEDTKPTAAGNTAGNTLMFPLELHSLSSAHSQGNISLPSDDQLHQTKTGQVQKQQELATKTSASQPIPIPSATATAGSIEQQQSGAFPFPPPLPPTRRTSTPHSSPETRTSAILSSSRAVPEADGPAPGATQSTQSLAAVYGGLMQKSAQALRAAGAVAGELPPVDDDNKRRRMKLRTASILVRQAKQMQAAQAAAASNNSSPSNRPATSSLANAGAGSTAETPQKGVKIDVRVPAATPGTAALLQHSNPTIQALGQMTQYMTGAHAAELPPEDSRRRTQRQASRVINKVSVDTVLPAGAERVMTRQTSVVVANASLRSPDGAPPPANVAGVHTNATGSSNSSPRQQVTDVTVTNISPVTDLNAGFQASRTSSQPPSNNSLAGDDVPRSGQLPRIDADNLRAQSIEPAPSDPFVKASQEALYNTDAYMDADVDDGQRRPDWEDPNHASSSAHFSGDVAEQLDALGLFAGADEDDDEDRQHDFDKVFSRRTHWYKMRYWRIYIVAQAIGLVLLLVGLIMQSQVARAHDINIGVYRWFYFFAGFPPIWLAVDILLHYVFRWLEWFFFRESLLYLHNVQRNTVTFIFLLLLLPWYQVMFVWAWCGDGECDAYGYNVVVDTVWSILLCVMLFSLANLIKALVAKLLSTHFYRSAHFQKLNTALEKEVFLQALSRPKRQVIEERAHLQTDQSKANVFSKLFSSDPPSPPAPVPPPRGGGGSAGELHAQDIPPVHQSSNIREQASASTTASDSDTDGSAHVTMKGDGSLSEKLDSSQHHVPPHQERVLLASETTTPGSLFKGGAAKAPPKLARNSMGSVEASSKSAPVVQELARNSFHEMRDLSHASMAPLSGPDPFRATASTSRAPVQPVVADPHKQVEANLKEISKRIMGASLAHHTAPRDIQFLHAWGPPALSQQSVVQPTAKSDNVSVHLRTSSDVHNPIRLQLETVAEDEEGRHEAPGTGPNSAGSIDRANAVVVPASMAAGPAMPAMFAMPNYMPMLPPTSMASAGAIPRPAMAYFGSPAEASSSAFSFAMLPSAMPLGSPVTTSSHPAMQPRAGSPVHARFPSPSTQRGVSASHSVDGSVLPAARRHKSRMAANPQGSASAGKLSDQASDSGSSQDIARPGSVPPLRGRSPFAAQQLPATIGLPPRPQPTDLYAPTPSPEHAKVVVTGPLPPPPPRTAPLPPPPMPLPWPLGKQSPNNSPPVPASPTTGNMDNSPPANQAQLTITVHPTAGDAAHDANTSPTGATALLPPSQNNSSSSSDHLITQADRRLPPPPPSIRVAQLDVRQGSRSLPPIDEGLVASPGKLEAVTPSMLKSNSNLRRNATIQRTSRRSNIADSVTSDRVRRGTSQVLGPMAADIIQTVPLKHTQDKDIAQMSEAELEKVRTAVVIKTYAAIVRNYSGLSAEDLEREATAIKAFSRALFHNIRDDPSRPYLTIEDFDTFFENPDHTARAFAVFDVDGDGHVSRKEVREAVEAIFRERANMADSLRDTDAIVQSLEFAVGAIVHFVFLAFYLLIFGVNIVQGFSTFSATLVAFTFIFGNAVRNMFEALLFLFVMHPFDVGDNINVEGSMYRVKKITLLITEVVCGTGERMFFPNTYLITKSITNLTRSSTKTEVVKIQVDVGVPPDVIADIMSAMVELCQASPTEYDGLPFIQYLEIASPMKVTLLATWTYAFQPDNWKRLVPARNAMYGILQAKLYEHRLKHTVQEVNRHVVSQLPGYDATTGMPYV